jgi:alkanesulfonate monooxygenase SsuD/methylene tetrahydromethanopterin reductase-like flavin-dependent oxidoreductase (luciferase family)
MSGLTFGLALDFGSRLRPVSEQLERQSGLFDSAEAAGFEMVAAGESSSPGAFHLPNALQVLSAVTQRTRMRLCTGVVLLPAWPVWRLALDAAQLDQLSGGRLILGVGLGTAALQARGGWPADSIAKTTDEYLECLRQLWSGASEFNGAHVRAMGSLPMQPLRSGGVPLWVGGGIRRSASRAARLGEGWYAGVSFPLSRIPAQVEAYRAAGGDGSVVVNRLTVIAETDSAAHQYVGPTLRSYAQPGQSLEEVISDVALTGTPEKVVAQLARYAQCGVTHVFARLSLDEMPIEVARGTIELMGRDVIPRFRK